MFFNLIFDRKGLSCVWDQRVCELEIERELVGGGGGGGEGRVETATSSATTTSCSWQWMLSDVRHDLLQFQNDSKKIWYLLIKNGFVYVLSLCSCVLQMFWKILLLVVDVCVCVSVCSCVACAFANKKVNECRSLLFFSKCFCFYQQFVRVMILPGHEDWVRGVHVTADGEFSSVCLVSTSILIFTLSLFCVSGHARSSVWWVRRSLLSAAVS